MSSKPKHSTDHTAPSSEHPTAIVPWHSRTISECIDELRCDPRDLLQTGLSSEEAQRRLQEYGQNKLSEKEKVTLLQRIWKQVANVLVGILVFVAIVSAIRAATAKETQNIITNWIQVGLVSAK
jgi:magnesium-transporting ATPase (P-type)